MCVYLRNKLGECVKKTFLAEMAKEISKARIMDVSIKRARKGVDD
jgi:hypothetical protein